MKGYSNMSDPLNRERRSVDHHTSSPGWLDARRLLVWQHGELFVINRATGQSSPTGLKAEKADYVFLR